MNHWKEREGALVKEFETNDFKTAIEKLNKIGEAAEEMGHHPDIELHSWNKLKFKLRSHETNEITDKDKELAKIIDEVLN